MPRIPSVAPDDMNDAQRQVYEDIMAGPRSSMAGPFNAWIHSPELADRAQKLGEFCRFHSSLEPRLSELAILYTARHWRAQFEWYAHEPMARQGGLSEAVITAIKAGEIPAFENSDEAALYEFCRELYTHQRVSDETYATAEAELGRQGVIDAVGILGYYALVSMTLNSFEMPLPEGVEPPFED
jgi:4-carboxymuconolactone decarboxylase